MGLHDDMDMVGLVGWGWVNGLMGRLGESYISSMVLVRPRPPPPELPQASPERKESQPESFSQLKCGVYMCILD